MKKYLVTSTMLAVLILIAVASGASAQSVMHPVSGEYGIVDVYDLEHATAVQVGNFCQVEVDAAYPFTGDLEGTAKLHFWALIHGPCGLDFFATKENYKATGTFYGTVLGEEGTLDLFYQGHGWPAEVGEQAVSSKIIIRSGTGELEGAKGVLAVTYLMGDEFDSYEGHVTLK
ncbi:MAG: DUF3224 domain-containing protein [Candidatus Promineifilaceae bacterium]|jgi:hypothetical protein